MSTPVGPYSPAVRAGPWLVCSGQIGIEQGARRPRARGRWVRGPGRARRSPTCRALLCGREVGWGTS